MLNLHEFIIFEKTSNVYMSVKNPIFLFFYEKLHACLVFMYENQNKIEKCSDFEKNLFFQLPGEKKTF